MMDVAFAALSLPASATHERKCAVSSPSMNEVKLQRNVIGAA